MLMLAEFNYNFSVIGLTETKYKADDDHIFNNKIPGYDFVSQPSLSNAGFYISNELNFTVRNDLSHITVDYESLWIELQSDLNHNIICGVIYRHPKTDLDAFLGNLNSTLDKINCENKYCIVMGDFNINLLNFESHSPTDEFLNTLPSYSFNLHILQPRITDHAATLIDNIFFNSIVHHTISGDRF